MKKRIITLVLSVLAVVLLFGVGYASWVVSQGASSEQTGNILVETVKDERLDVSIVSDGKSFQFGAPTGATTGWLHEDGVDAVAENLVVKFTVTVTRPTAFELEGGQPKGLSLTAELKDKMLDGSNAEVAYPAALFDRDAVSYGVNAANDDSHWTMSNENKTAETTIVVSLKWGTLFNAENPYDFFNAQSVDGVITSALVSAASAAGLVSITAESTYGDLAVAALEAVYNYNSYKFQLTVAVNA